MNRPNPFIPQGSLLEDATKCRRKVRFLVFAALAVLTTLLFGLLIEGCRHPAQKIEGSVLGSAKAAPSSITTAPSTSTAPPTTNRPLVAAPTTSPASRLHTAQPLKHVATSVISPSIVRGSSYRVAAAIGLSTSARIDPPRLKAEQTLQVPGATTTPPTIRKSPSVVLSTNTFYVVKSGDLLSQIARMHGTTTKALREANWLQTNRILVGQKLRLPHGDAASAPQEVSYE
jgi:LysM repeat protein